MDITHDIPPTQSIPLINYANNNKLPLIIGSDTNAQHTLWGNRECNKRGKLVCSLVPLNHIKDMINDKVNSLTYKRWNTNRHAHTDLILGNHHKNTLKILTNNLNNSTRYRTGICIITGHRPQQTPSQD